MIVNSNWQQSPILIYGARKSGTTLLQNLMDGHPDILTIPGETKLKQLVTLKNCHENMDDAWQNFLQLGLSMLYPLNGEGKIDLGNLSADEINSVFDKALYVKSLTEPVDAQERQQYLATAMIVHAERLLKAIRTRNMPPSYWLMKEVGSPGYEIILLFRSLFPAGRIILIKRDHMHVVRSIVMDRRKRGIKLTRAQLILEWKKALKIEKMIGQLIRYPVLDVHVVEYQDLVNNTESEMKKICSYLNVPFSESQLTPSILGVKTTVHTASRPEQKVFKDQLHRKWYTDLALKEKTYIGLADKLFRYLA